MARRARVSFFRLDEALGGPINELKRPTEERAMDRSITRPIPMGRPGPAKGQRPRRAGVDPAKVSLSALRRAGRKMRRRGIRVELGV
jgi:hypothetical protein